MAETLWKVGRRITAFPDLPIRVALTEKDVDLMDGDLAIPLMYVLDSLASWGLLVYDCDEPVDDDIYWRFKINHKHPNMMKDLMDAVEEMARRSW